MRRGAVCGCVRYFARFFSESDRAKVISPTAVPIAKAAANERPVDTDGATIDSPASAWT